MSVFFKLMSVNDYGFVCRQTSLVTSRSYHVACAWSTPTMYLPEVPRYLIVLCRRLATNPQLIHRLPTSWPHKERSATAEHFQIETPLRPPLLADVSFIPRRRGCCYRAQLCSPSPAEAGRPAERHHNFQLLLLRSVLCRLPVRLQIVLNSYACLNFKLI